MWSLIQTLVQHADMLASPVSPETYHMAEKHSEQM